MSLKSTFSNSTSKSYALALYELAKENSELNKVADGMNGLKTLSSESSDFKEMILNPTVTKEEKNKVIIEMVNQYNFCQTLKKFLSFITSKNRLFFFLVPLLIVLLKIKALLLIPPYCLIQGLKNYQ